MQYDYYQQVPAKTNAKKIWLPILIIGGILLILCIVAGVLTIYFNKTEVVVRNSVLSTMSQVTERQEIAPMMEMLQNGSLQVKLEGSFDGNSVNADGKVYFSEGELLINLLFDWNQVSVSAGAYVSDDYMYVQNSDILNGNVGLVRGQSASGFRSSIFAYGSGSDLSLSAGDSDAIENALQAYDNCDPEKMREDVQELLEKYIELFFESLEARADYTKETKNVTVCGISKNGRVITVTVGERALLNILKDLYAEASRDTQLRKLFVDNLTGCEDLLVSLDILGKNKTVSDLWEELIDEIGKELDQMENRLDLRGYDSFSVTAEIVTSALSSDLAKLTVSFTDYDSAYDTGDQEEVFRLEIGWEGIEDTNKIVLSIEEDDEVFTYEITENSDSTYRARLVLSDRYYDYPNGYYNDPVLQTRIETLLSINVDRVNESYTLILDEDIRVKGSFCTDDEITTITLSQIIEGDENFFEGMLLTVIINEDDDMPEVLSARQVRSVFSLTKADLERILDDCEELLEDAEKKPTQPLSGTYAYSSGAYYSHFLAFIANTNRVIVTTGMYGTSTVEECTYALSADQTVLTIYKQNGSNESHSINISSGYLVLDGTKTYWLQ